MDRDEEFVKWRSENVMTQRRLRKYAREDTPETLWSVGAKAGWYHWWPVVEHIEKALKELEVAQEYPIAVQGAEHELNAALEVVRGR